MQKFFKMSVCWMFTILLGCRLLHASQSQNTCDCNHSLKTVCVAARGRVEVPCPNMTGEDMTFILLKDEEVIHNKTCSYEKHASNCTFNTSNGVALLEHNRSVNFILTEMTDSSNGTYRCEGMVIYPPPFRKEPSPLTILVVIEGHQCQCSTFATGGHQVFGLHWIWISVIAVLFIYSVVVSIIAVVNYIKLGRSDSQCDYMNTKPRAPKDRKKKRGFLDPIPRHF